MTWQASFALGILSLALLVAGCPAGDDDDAGDDDSGADDDDAGDDDVADDDDVGDDDDIGDDDDTVAPPAPCFPQPVDTPECPPGPAPDDDGYFDGIDPGSQSLKQNLHNLISNFDRVSYDDLWDVFPYTDDDGSGHVWDMYSDNPGGSDPYSYDFDDACGQYGEEGDCYNREHTWPTDWNDSDTDMKSDLNHVFPTDGYVNGRRGNLPFGIVDDVDWQSLNGSLRGECDHDGSDLDVFEPIDEYKGDLARVYFYVAVAYAGSSWSSNEMVTNASINDDAEAMLRQWHEADPVSDKERDRNAAVYWLQENRNPFIDYPEWVCLIEDF